MNDNLNKISRGEVFYISSMYPTVGSEQKGGRPAVVVSNNKNNESSTCVEICYLTLREKQPLPTHVKIDKGDCYNSTILCEQITTVSKDRLGDYVCSLPDYIMDLVDKALITSLALDYTIEHEKVIKIEPEKAIKASPAPATSVHTNDNFELIRLKQELDFYKKQYENLLDKVVGK